MSHGKDEPAIERSDRVVRHAQLDFHVTQWGPLDGWPVVMLHGIRGYAETFANVARALQPGMRVIAFDQRGRGRTSWDASRNYYTDAYLSDLAGIVDTLGLPRFDLLGHSMGGITAIAYAAAYPDRVRRLVIEDAGPGAFTTSAGALRIQQELQTTPERFDSWDEARAFMRALRPAVTEAAREQRLHSMLKPLPTGGYTWCYDHAGIAQTRLHPDPARVTDLLPLIGQLQCETLVVRGGRSDYLQPDMVDLMRSANPSIQAVAIEDAGHYVHDDQPEAFHRAVAGFLRR